MLDAQTSQSASLAPVDAAFQGNSFSDPFHWLEEQDSVETRSWLEKQRSNARAYLDSIVGRESARKRVREYLAVESCDSLQKAGERYIYRKRLAEQEQPAIYVRQGTHGPEKLLVDPAARRTGTHTSVKPIRVSPDGRILLYEVKESGERTATFELLEIETGTTLTDSLPRGVLRGFSFSPDSKSFCYVHTPVHTARPFYRAVFQHTLGSRRSEDREIFFAGEDQTVRLLLFSGEERFGILVQKQLEKTFTTFLVRAFGENSPIQTIVSDIEYAFEPLLIEDRLFAVVDDNAPNRKVVEIVMQESGQAKMREAIPELESRISQWAIADQHIFVSYVKGTRTEVHVHDFSGKRMDDLPAYETETLRLIGPTKGEELCFESESFADPISLWRYEPRIRTRHLWSRRRVPFDPSFHTSEHVWYTSKDGTRVPMTLFGRKDALIETFRPTIMTSYGGYGLSMTPKFSVLVAFLVERGCLFALPNIRGGAEFGNEWHNGGKRLNRQNAFDDFISAAEWLIENNRTSPQKLAIFGGSNSGLLVGVAMTQRPELYRAVLCMVPLLDMLRYHLFDDARNWRDEFGVADNPADLAVLASYSPYHHVRKGVSYPATMIVSGDADTNCNPLHARKMTARLQESNVSPHPIILDYSSYRGHSPVLPLSERVDALTDRIAFLCDQLQISM